MDFTEIKNKPLAELKELLVECQSKLRELRFSAHEGQLKNTQAFRLTKKLIARLQTLITSAKSL